MKKSKKIALISIASTIVIAGGVAIAKLAPVIGAIIKEKFTGEEEITDPEILDIIDGITDEESDRTKKEIEDIISKKQDPDDIIIPEDADEDVKEELTSQKKYWTIMQKVEQCVENYKYDYFPVEEFGESQLLNIKNIYYNLNRAYFHVEFGSEYEGKYFYKNIVFSIDANKTISSEDDIIDILSTPTNFEKEAVFNKYRSNYEINEKIYFDAMSEGAQVLLDEYDNEILEEAYEETMDGVVANASYYLVKLSNETEERYELCKFFYSFISNGKTQEEFEDYVKNNKASAIMEVSNYFYPLEDFSWQDYVNSLNLSSENTTPSAESSASAASAFETEDGFDYPAYMAAKVENEAKKAKNTSDEIVLAVGDNGRITIKNSDLMF